VCALTPLVVLLEPINSPKPKDKTVALTEGVSQIVSTCVLLADFKIITIGDFEV
jgi:hypothetical protein